jgi:hypothetical protein
MKIDTIFEVIKDKLYVIRWDTKDVDELIDLFGDEKKEYIGQWQNVEFLKDFFNQFGEDLRNGFFDTTKTINAIKKTIDEANILKRRLIELAESDNGENLENLFKPLNNSKELYEYQEQKAYGTEHKNWLRLYAIRISENMYLVTGGAIKLTTTMNTRTHLKLELYKLKLALKFLKEKNSIQKIK